jgi:NAD-dependent SIR2 family protein deacetylase
LTHVHGEPAAGLTCLHCGTSDGVRHITFSRNQRQVTEPLCETCKGAMLARVRVRAARRKRPLVTMRNAGLFLIGAGVLAFVALIVWVATG